MTTIFEAGRFWVIDSATLAKVPTFPSFGTWREARTAIGNNWSDPCLEDC